MGDCKANREYENIADTEEEEEEEELIDES